MDYDTWKTTPPEDPPVDLESVASALRLFEKARGKLEKANVLLDAMRDRLFAIEEEIETMIEDLK